LIEHLSSKHKLLSSNPVPQKKKEEEEKGRKEGSNETHTTEFEVGTKYNKLRVKK
jgi:hypothetical protein